MSRKTKVLALAAIAGLATSTGAFAATYVQASVTGGVMIVNQSNGAITFCSGLINGSTQQPFGQCKLIGQLAGGSLANNVQIASGNTANLSVFVTNVSTGVIAQCSVVVNGSTGVPLGRCVDRKAD